MTPKVCENKGKHRHFLQNVFFAVFRSGICVSECKGSSELGRERKEQTPPDRDQTPSATITTSKKMLIGAMKMSLLLEIFFCCVSY